MSEASEGHQGTVSVECRTIMNLHYTDDIVGLAALADELADLINCTCSAAPKNWMQINAGKNETDGKWCQLYCSWYHNQWKEAWDGTAIQIPRSRHEWGGITTRNLLKNSVGNKSIDKTEGHMERQQHYTELQILTPACTGILYIFICMWSVENHSRLPEENSGNGDEILSHNHGHIISRSCHK